MNAIRNTLVICLIAVSVNRGISQGVVNFANQPLGPSQRIFDADGMTPISGINFIAELLYQDNSGTWVAHPATATFYDSSLVNVVGYWRGGGRTLVNAGGINPTNPILGRPVNMQVRVWDGGAGMIVPLTFDQAVASGMKWGTSIVFVYEQEYDLATDDTWMKRFQNFNLVPEPSVWALFALGMGWLVWRRRRLG